MYTAIATAADTDRFSDASLYCVTYVGQSDLDKDVRWGYLRQAARRGVINRVVVCRDKDGRDAGTVTII
jgi:hypothetical protein